MKRTPLFRLAGFSTSFDLLPTELNLGVLGVADGVKQRTLARLSVSLSRG